MFLDRAGLDETRDRIVQCHVAPADRRRSRPAIGLEDVAIDGDLDIGEQLQRGHGAKRAANESLNFLSST